MMMRHLYHQKDKLLLSSVSCQRWSSVPTHANPHTQTTVLWPLYRSTSVSWNPIWQMEDFTVCMALLKAIVFGLRRIHQFSSMVLPPPSPHRQWQLQVSSRPKLPFTL